LSIFLENLFDIDLSDYEMPGIDGVVLACSIKRNAPRTRVVISAVFIHPQEKEKNHVK